MNLEINVVAPARLTPADVDAWSRIQRGNDDLRSPFFHPEFTQLLATVRDDVEVAVLRKKGRPVGFFPYHRFSRSGGVPIGDRLSDFHGVIAPRGFRVPVAELLSRCRLSVWNYTNLLPCQDGFANYHYGFADSPYIDVSSGLEAYLERRRQLGNRELRYAYRKIRKAEREVGPVRFEPLVEQVEDVLGKLVCWKERRYQCQGVSSPFATSWTIRFLRGMLARREEAFGGMLSALYVGNQLAASLLSMRCHGVCHAMFIAYDAQLARYSPGMMLFASLIRTAPGLGLQRIDLGRGSQRYKRALMTGTFQVSSGSVDPRFMSARIRGRVQQLRSWIECTPLRRPLRTVAHGITSLSPAMKIWLNLY